MFAKQWNQIRIDLSITPRAPLLIRSGRKGADPTRPDLEAVRTAFQGAPSVYIPGSSLKGVMRSHAERLLRSEDVQITATFDKKNPEDYKQKTPGDVVFRGTSPLGRTFGTLFVKSRVSMTDLLPGGRESGAARQLQIDLANATEQRNGVAIDRLTGSAAGAALFDQEVVVQGRFDGRILMRNAQLYQLALLLLVLRDMEEGFVQLGSGTSRGNGWVSARVHEIVIETRRGLASPGKLLGVGKLASEASGYALFDNDEMDLPAGLIAEDQLVWSRLTIPRDKVDDLAEALVAGPWSGFLDCAKVSWAA